MSNNALLVNAALGGAVGGMGQGLGLFALNQVAAKAFAVAIDLAIPNEPLISNVAGAPLVPTTALIVADQSAWTCIMTSISYAYFAQRGNQGAAAAVNANAIFGISTIAIAAFNVRVAT